MLSFLLNLSYIFATVLVGLIVTFVILVIVLRITLEPIKGVCKCKTELQGKTVLITGGNSGIGLETAKDLARRGASVIIASRNVEKSEDAVKYIRGTTGNNKVEYRYLNLGNKDSVVKFAVDFNKEFDSLDILVNNAGCGAIKRKTTEDGIDLLMQVNYVGPFLLTHLLLDKLIASKPSRIVNVSSLVHRFAKLNVEDLKKCGSNSDLIRYSKTKLCDVLWTRALAKKLPHGVTANVLHPGLVKTNIFEFLHPYLKKVLFLLIDLLYKTPVEGAQTIIHLCVSPNLDNATGGYYMDCKRIEPSKIAQNDDLAEELWIKTLELIKQ
ncbi:unnamed protein product [Euphydryas editha]|uniref:Retinol dehydrogenase 13 n=1 Tax=Euphydryas editha TaxID=104508 RepID=A0AAU9UIT8_EUPED|nr:unnamed protein product [Euphydryas editha]